MKLKVFDRILLGILLIAAILLSFVLFGIAAGLIQEDMVAGFISLFYMFRENALILAAAGWSCCSSASSCCLPAGGKRRSRAPRPR
jgi:hypothetical protein